MKKSAGGGATSQQDMDTAKAAFEVAEAKLRVNQKALDLAVIGPRKEDIAEARATLLSNEAELAVSKQDLAYATLVSPTNGVVQNRILEPGEMASPQRAVLTIAITDPKWVRVYAEEPDLGKIRMGMTATVTTDSFPGQKIRRLGRIHLPHRLFYSQDGRNNRTAFLARLRSPNLRKGPGRRTAVGDARHGADSADRDEILMMVEARRKTGAADGGTCA